MKFVSHIGKKISGFTAAFNVKHESKLKHIAKGEIFLKITDNGVLKDTVLIGEKSVPINPETKKALLGTNIVVLDASTLLARLMKDPTEPAAGVSYFALGKGNAGWDKFNPPAPEDTQTTLQTEVDRVQPSSASFINQDTGLVSMVPTNIVDWNFDFNESQAVDFLCEAGLFGGDATAVKNSGTLITYKTFPVFQKRQP